MSAIFSISRSGVWQGRLAVSEDYFLFVTTRCLNADSNVAFFFANRRGTIKGREIIFQGTRDNFRGSETTPSWNGINETVQTG
jgi:hypothetical protein